jgi:two-component system chemotaxis response regulator CheY
MQTASKNVLIVDDSRTVRMMLRSVLESAGLVVTEAIDGRNALTALEGRPVDLIITDVNMPEMDGISLVRELRSRASFPRIPILILTTVQDADMKEQGRLAGATGWMCKPFQPEQIRSVVGKVLAR